jgi:NADPH:quinone reductase-like Zn-dependent oxidoreductase
MKAILYTKYGPPEVLKISEVPKPTPKDNEVLIRIRATTVSVADYRVRSFDVPKSFYIPARLALGITGPRNKILGAELAGDIEAVGRNVTKYKPGDQVFASTLTGMGAYAEYKCIPENGALSARPKNISYEEAAAIPIGACTAVSYLKRANIAPGKKVLVYGASGSVGTYTVQLAKLWGAEVTGVCSAPNMDLVRSLGAHKVLDYTKPGFESHLEKYDIIFVAVDKISFSVCREHLTTGGVYVNITLPLKPPSMALAAMASKIKIVAGGASPGEKAGELPELRDLVESNQLKVVIDRKYTLDQIVEAHAYVGTGRKKGNVVITV